MEYRGPFDGFRTVPASMSKTCTVRFDNNKYYVLNPWHWVAVLVSSLAHCAMARRAKGGFFPRPWSGVRRKLKSAHHGDHQMVAILRAVLSDGLDAVEAARQEALDQNVCSSAAIINILAPDVIRLRR
ncbi:hypothetical protein [Mesorhizobium sp. ORM16]|uniref:hypothetical protein n=1 Tax=Mesorhizobium sp. ORM16 TaxID=3376989 RepID=UPI0038578C0F